MYNIHMYVYKHIYLYTYTHISYTHIDRNTHVQTHRQHMHRRLHSRFQSFLLGSLLGSKSSHLVIAHDTLSWQIFFGLWHHPAVVLPPFGNTNAFNVHCVCAARRSRREYDIAAGWHSRPGFGMFAKTVRDPTNEEHHLLASHVLSDALL